MSDRPVFPPSDISGCVECYGRYCRDAEPLLKKIISVCSDQPRLRQLQPSVIVGRDWKPASKQGAISLSHFSEDELAKILHMLGRLESGRSDVALNHELKDLRSRIKSYLSSRDDGGGSLSPASMDAIVTFVDKNYLMPLLNSYLVTSRYKSYFEQLGISRAALKAHLAAYDKVHHIDCCEQDISEAPALERELIHQYPWTEMRSAWFEWHSSENWRDMLSSFADRVLIEEHWIFHETNERLIIGYLRSVDPIIGKAIAKGELPVRSGVLKALAAGDEKAEDFYPDYTRPFVDLFTHLCKEHLPGLIPGFFFDPKASTAPRMLAAGLRKLSECRQPEIAARNLENKHGNDFRSILWDGRLYSFTESQACVVRILWENWERGTAEVGTVTLLNAIDEENDRQKLSTVFRDCPAWGTIIKPGSTKNSYRLVSLKV